MPHNLTNEQVNNVTAHHEAGHACLMVKCDLPVPRLERLPNGSAQVVPVDPNWQPSQAIDLYTTILALRASRFSQKLSPYNNPEVEAESFGTPGNPGDDQALERHCHGLYLMYSPHWVADRTAEDDFRAELLAVADAELTDVFASETFRIFVKEVAAVFINRPNLPQEEVRQLVEGQWDATGADADVSHYSDFINVCARDSPVPPAEPTAE